MRRSPILSLNVSQKSSDKYSLRPAPLLRPAPQCCQSCCGLRSCSRSILDILPEVRALTMPSSGATRRPGRSMRTQCPRRISRHDAEPKFMSQRGPTRNVSSHHHHHHHHHRTFGHKRTTCSELSGGRKKKNNQAIISHTTAPEMSSAAPRRTSSHSSSAGLTSEEPVSSREHQRRGERVLPARTSSQTHQVEALSRFIHPPVAPEPSLPMKLVTGRGDSSNAIFVTPSWDSLSPLLLLRAQPAQPPQMN